MRKSILIISPFLSLIGSAQTDTLHYTHKNVVSIEIGGGSYAVLGFGSFPNLGYLETGVYLVQAEDEKHWEIKRVIIAR